MGTTHATCLRLALASIVLCSSLARAQPTQTAAASSQSQDFSRAIYETYILGPGDVVFVELVDIPELSGTFSIGPDGTIYLPRLRALYVEGLSIEELRYFLEQQFKAYVKKPQVYIKPVGYRSVRVYVGGEVIRPGYYTLAGDQTVVDPLAINEQSPGRRQISGSSRPQALPMQTNADDVSAILGIKAQSANRWPTLFDALRAAQGVTPYSNLGEVRVVRKQPLGSGGGRIQANVDFLRLLSNGDEAVNIRLFDGDVITVGRSPQVLRDQLLAASRTNLSPDFIEIFVSGRVKEPGPQTLRQGATLNQAIASAGGLALLRGKVEFLRFSPDGATDRRQFSFDAGAQAGAYTNPVLISGDVVRVNESLLSASIGVFNELTGPFLGIYSVYSLFR